MDRRHNMLSWSPAEINSLSHFLNFKKLNLFNIQKILVLIHTYQLASGLFPGLFEWFNSWIIQLLDSILANSFNCNVNCRRSNTLKPPVRLVLYVHSFTKSSKRTFVEHRWFAERLVPSSRQAELDISYIIYSLLFLIWIFS